MAGNFTNYAEDAILNHIFDQATLTVPDLYVSLHSGNPGETGGSYEVTGTGYARVSTDSNDWILSSPGLIHNFNEIVFALAEGYWGWITYFGLFDALSGGNLLIYGPLTPSEEIQYGDIVKFEWYDLTITLD